MNPAPSVIPKPWACLLDTTIHRFASLISSEFLPAAPKRDTGGNH